ncbi:hypothetical protein [Kitasatospora sp. GP82]|uniref:hypothetical protein n=1 Tax=Kitasatospora sp. GP82 TaxID=3035089 RepID=UPI00247360C8|nr:hypothetical protein [Kitasatospora sp. GP82]MDH6126358.1 phosphate transport system protein [Kitasatospora sp. GP82]
MPHTPTATIERLVHLVQLAATALSRVSKAALDAEGSRAEQELAAAESVLVPLHEEIEDGASVLLAGRGPVPEDLREVVADAHVGGDVQQLTDLARRVGEIAWARRSRGPFPDPVRQPLRGMSSLAVEMVAKAGGALQQAAPETIADLHGGLNEIGQRQRLLYGQLLAAEPPFDRVDVVDAVLLGCCFECCAGHALSVARHAVLFTARPWALSGQRSSGRR